MCLRWLVVLLLLQVSHQVSAGSSSKSVLSLMSGRYDVNVFNDSGFRRVLETELFVFLQSLLLHFLTGIFSFKNITKNRSHWNSLNLDDNVVMVRRRLSCVLSDSRVKSSDVCLSACSHSQLTRTAGRDFV